MSDSGTGISNHDAGRVRPPYRIAGWIAAIGLVVAFLYYAMFWPCWIDPVAWTPDPDPGLTGVFAANDALTRVTPLARGADGPEDVELGPDGWLYASLRDGRIIRFDRDHADTFQVFTNTHGFPLGLEFDIRGELIVADGDRGLLAVAPDGGVRVLLDGIGGVRFRFADDLAIAGDGIIWFSDAYDQGPADLQMNAWEGKATGRLLSLDPASGEARLHVSGLSYANGVTLGPDDDYVLITEMLGARVVRYWIKGPRRGEHETFLSALPGYPDNIAFDGARTFWLAFVSTRTPAYERWSRYPAVRAFVAKAPLLQAPHPVPSLRNHRYMAWVVGVDTTGVVRHNLQTPVGDYGTITSANAYGGYLYLGSIRMKSVGRFDLSLLEPSAPR
jgi:sugar lactone lactonase YvrE